jgi:hypothetical protein
MYISRTKVKLYILLYTFTDYKWIIKDIIKEKYENIIKSTCNRTHQYNKKHSNIIKTLKNYL